jgi:hypothetical protein
MTSSNGFAETLVSAVSQVHRQLRKQVEGLSGGALSWQPAEDTNSISTIVVHMLGSQAELLSLVKGLPADRDRATEFATPPQTAAALLELIDLAEQSLHEIGTTIGEADLSARFIRPSAVRNKEPRTGLFWLLNGYGHAREHLAQIELTRQVYMEREQG